MTVNDIGINDILDAGEDMGGSLSTIERSHDELGAQISDYFNNHEDRASITKVEITANDDDGLIIKAYNGNAEILDDDGNSFYENADPFYGMG